MALEFIKDLGAGIGPLGQGIGGFTSSLTDLFGGTQEASVSGTKKEKGTTTEQLQIDEAGVQKILQDILESKQGLAPIFSEENVAGIYNSTAASAAAGDLLTRLAGEIAKLTAKKVRDVDSTVTTEQTTKTEDKGLIGQLFG